MIIKRILLAIPKAFMIPTGGILMFFAAWAQNPGKVEIHIQTRPTQSHPIEHRDLVNFMTFSPDGKTLATTCNKIIKLWEISTGRLIRSFEGHTDRIHALAFSPDGKTMLSVSNSDKTMKLWNVSTAQIIHSLNIENPGYFGDVGPLNFPAFSPDGEMLISESTDAYGRSDRMIKYWKVSTGELIRSFNLPTNKTSAIIALSPDQKTLASVSYNNTFTLWEMDTGRFIRSWEADAKNLPRSFEGHSQPVYYLTFSPDGKMLVSMSGDKTIKLWEVSTGRYIRTFEGTGFKLIAFSSDGRLLIAGVTSQIQHSFNFWELSTGRLVRSVEVDYSGSYAAAVSPDGSRLATSTHARAPSDYYGIAILSARTSSQLATLASFDDGNWIAFTPDHYYQSSPEASKYVSWLGQYMRPHDESYIKSQFNFPGMVEAKLQEREATPQDTIASLLPTGKDVALVIGINEYQYLKKLKTAVNDAEVVVKALSTHYSFQTKVLLNANATRDKIIAALREYQRTLAPNDRLLIYYAGHGDIDRDKNKAYWKPVDADDTSKSNWISEDILTNIIGGIPARHILIMSDSCYSATIVRGSRFRSEAPRARGSRLGSSTPEAHRTYLEKMMLGKSRILIASGGKEPVADNGPSGHSVFANALLSGLYNMDQPGFTAQELFSNFVEKLVVGSADQTPQYNRLFDAGHEEGDFVFIRRN
jgi:WD40 repeat protein